MMGNSKQEPGTEKTAARKTGRKPRRLSAKTGANSTSLSEPATEPESELGDGGTLLRNAVDKLVARQCDRIARALVEGTIAGNMTSARLLSELSGAKYPHNKPPKKRPGLSWAEQLALEPPWEGPLDSNEEKDVLASQTAA